MKKFCLDLIVVSVSKINDRYVLIKLTHNEELPQMEPGQFVEVRVDGSPTTFLRRPISINFIDRKNNQLWLLVATVGDGTHKMAQLKEGEILNCVLPLGKSFTMPQQPQEKYLLVGGGVGTAPMLYLGEQLKEIGCTPTFLLGARSQKDLLELENFEPLGRLFVTTEDGTAGEKGFVTNHSILQNETFDRIYVCGPTPMMKAVAQYARQNNIECEVSLENMMACGVGACLCCVEKTTEGNLCVCTDGPVFNIKQLLWQS